MALLGAPITQAADHLDSDALATNPMADINDVFAWMTNSGANVSLAMTVAPFDDGTHEFGDAVQYVFHLNRYEALPQSAETIGAGEESKVICTFASATSGQCWVIDPSNKVVDYVTGDFTAAGGVASADGKLKVFAGQRSDPFFFNFGGFLRAHNAIVTTCGNGDCPTVLKNANMTDEAGCPEFTQPQVQPLVGMLTTPPPADVPLGGSLSCPAGEADCFAGRNVMAIVVDLDKTLVTTDAKALLGVWGSTHATP
jgi:hypothetical protein